MHKQTKKHRSYTKDFWIIVSLVIPLMVLDAFTDKLLLFLLTYLDDYRVGVAVSIFVITASSRSTL